MNTNKAKAQAAVMAATLWISGAGQKLQERYRRAAAGEAGATATEYALMVALAVVVGGLITAAVIALVNSTTGKF